MEQSSSGRLKKMGFEPTKTKIHENHVRDDLVHDIDRLNIDDEDGGRNEEARRPPTHKLPPFYGVQEFHANIWHRVA